MSVPGPWQLDAWAEQYAARHRFGADPIGALRRIDRERVVEACGLARRGAVHALFVPRAGLPVPRLRGRPAQLERALVMRGVLLDVARHRDVPWLPDGEPVLPAELDACAEAQGVAVEAGDALLLRTGRLARRAAEGEGGEAVDAPTPGLSVHCARWLHERGVVLAATDGTSVEVLPEEAPQRPRPLRAIAQEAGGIVFAENLWLEDLAAGCALDRDHAFLLVALAGPRPGATTAPVRAVAIK